MFIHKLALFSLVLAQSMVPSVDGIKHHLRKEVVADPDISESSESLDNNTFSDALTDGGESISVNGLARSLGSQGDWSSCSMSSECGSGCCSGKYSNNSLKCTPLGSGFDPVSNGCVSGSPSTGGGTSTTSTWTCRTNNNPRDVGVVTIWWGHKASDASWACNNWISSCPQNGQCTAYQGVGSASSWLNAHNNRRMKYHGIYGRSYVPMKWSSSLEQDARNYAQTLVNQRCGLVHSQTRGTGENLYWTSSSTPSTAETVLSMWTENEEPKVLNGNFGDWGHFTQVIWRATKYVGCGVASGGCGSVAVCRYVAAGNCLRQSDFANPLPATLGDNTCNGASACPREGCF